MFDISSSQYWPLARMDSHGSRGGHMAEGGLMCLVEGHTHNLTSKHIGPVDLLPYPIYSQPLSCSWVSSGTSWKYTCKSCLSTCKYICILKRLFNTKKDKEKLVYYLKMKKDSFIMISFFICSIPESFPVFAISSMSLVPILTLPMDRLKTCEK